MLEEAGFDALHVDAGCVIAITGHIRLCIRHTACGGH